MLLFRDHQLLFENKFYLINTDTGNLRHVTVKLIILVFTIGFMLFEAIIY